MSIDFGKIKSDIVSAGKDISVKAKEVSDTAKIKVDIRTKEDYLAKQYEALGRQYYEAHKDDEDAAEKECFANIAEAQKEIDMLNDQLLTLQGAVICPNCGVKQVNDDNYCKNCGAPLK